MLVKLIFGGLNVQKCFYTFLNFHNQCLVLNTQAVCSWAARQKISFAEWHSDLDGWVVYGEDVPEEWSK